MHSLHVIFNMEKEMKVRTNNNGMKQLKKLGFKKIKTEPGFHMFELNPAALRAPQTAKRPSAQARKRSSSQAHKLDK